jgi:CubicO group peptidase (beta-lactamase class C family)
MDNQGTPPARDYWPTNGWRTADPADHGLDPAQLAAAQAHLDQHVQHIDSLLIARGGYLVYEHDRAGTDPVALRSVKSMTKSVTSALIGIALQAGDLESVDEKIGALMPEMFAAGHARNKRDISVRDLLTMRSGLEWAEYGPNVTQMTGHVDWTQYVLERPLIHPPGTVFNYSTGDTQLLAALLHKITGMTALAYADLYLFGPLGIERRRWSADPQGITVGGTELALAPRDMAKFGYLYLNRGVWDGETILPAAWVSDSAFYHTLFAPQSPDDCLTLGYGYLWWLRPQGKHESMIAVGYGGQFVYVIPDLDLVIVMTGIISAAPEDFRSNRMLCAFNLVEDLIVPAVNA